MKKDLQDARNRIEKAKVAYQFLRETCNHPPDKLIWKHKYGGYYCDDCEQFLPRTNIEGKVTMNKQLKWIKEDLVIAMKQEIEIKKNPADGDFIVSQQDSLDKAIAQKTVSRAIISMIPETGKKPNDTTEEDILKLVKKYAAHEKERSLYELSYLKREDVEGKSASEVKKIVKNKIQDLGDELTSYPIEIAKRYLPKAVSEDEITEFISTLDLTQFKNKLQAMGLIMKEFPGCDGNLAKKVLLSI